MRTLLFTIPGLVKPKERPRVSRRGGRVYTPTATLESEAKVLLCYRNAAPGAALMRFGVAITCTFYLPDRQPRDLDNMEKTVLDALNGSAFADDRQVVRAAKEKFLDPSNPRVEIALADLGPCDLVPEMVLTKAESKAAKLAKVKRKLAL